MCEQDETPEVTITEPESEPPARVPFRARLKHAYLHTLPRLVWEVRWLILVMVAVEVAGLVVGYRAAGRTTLSQTMDNPQGVPPYHTPFEHLFFFADQRHWGYGGIGFFVSNSIKVIYAWLWSLFTVGGYALWAGYFNGWRLGWILCTVAPQARAASGIGPVGVAVILLPRGLLEIPACALGWALGVRTGLAWLWRAPGCGRWASLGRWLRNSGLALALILPMLFAAGFLEVHVTPHIADRYLRGVGISSQLRSETILVGTALGGDLGRPTVAPTGDKFAEHSDAKVCISTFRPCQRRVYACRRKDLMGSPAWSSDGRRLAVPLRGEKGPDALLILDTTTERVSLLPAGEGQRYSDPAWSPKGNAIAMTAMVGERPRRFTARCSSLTSLPTVGRG